MIFSYIKKWWREVSSPCLYFGPFKVLRMNYYLWNSELVFSAVAPSLVSLKSFTNILSGYILAVKNKRKNRIKKDLLTSRSEAKWNSVILFFFKEHLVLCLFNVWLKFLGLSLRAPWKKTKKEKCTYEKYVQRINCSSLNQRS